MKFEFILQRLSASPDVSSLGRKKTEPEGVVEIDPTFFTSLTKQLNLGLPEQIQLEVRV